MKDTERHNYIGDHIRKLREEKGWTQQVLGKKLGKKTSTISAYETNAKLPSVDCLIEMAELFDVSLDTLVYGDRSNLISIRALRPEQKELISELTQVFSARHTTAEQRLGFQGGIVGVTVAVHKPGGHLELVQQGGNVLAAPMDQHHPHPHFVGLLIFPAPA